MKTGTGEALLITLVMGAVIFFCRACSFIFFRGKDPQRGTDSEIAADGKSGGKTFLNFVEKTIPPLAVTVLTFNALTSPIHENIRESVPTLAAAFLTAILHLWRRNPLISIFGGTAAYMILERLLT